MAELEFYPTPAWMTRALLAHAPITGRVLEPCAGNGAIADVLLREGYRCGVLQNDLVPRSAGFTLPFTRSESARFGLSARDATDPRVWEEWRDFDWIVTNPPFSRAAEILPLAHKHAYRGVAFLVRLSYHEPALERVDWLKAHPPTLVIYLPRCSFDGQGTDLVACQWNVWLHDARGHGTRLIWVSRAEAVAFTRPLRLGRDIRISAND